MDRDYKARNSSSLDDTIRVVADRNRQIAVTPDSSHDNIEKGFASAYDDKFHKKQEKRRALDGLRNTNFSPVRENCWEQLLTQRTEILF